MKCRVVTLFALLLLQSLCSKAQIVAEWERSISDTLESNLTGFITDRFGNTFCMLTNSSNSTIIKYNSDGVVEWKKPITYNLAKNTYTESHYPRKFATDDEGNFYFVGLNSNSNMFHLVKVNSSGNTVFETPLNPYYSYSNYTIATALVVLPSGIAYVSIASHINGWDKQPIYKIDQSGNTLNIIQQPYRGRGILLLVDDEANVYFKASYSTSLHDYNHDLFKYDSLGNLLWSRSDHDFYSCNVKLTPDGNLIFITYDTGHLIKLSSLDGSVITNVSLPGYGSGTAAEDEDGNIYCLAYDDGQLLNKYDQNFNLIYSKSFDYTSDEDQLFLLPGESNELFVVRSFHDPEIAIQCFRLDNNGTIVDSSNGIFKQADILHYHDAMKDQNDNLYFAFNLWNAATGPDCHLIKFCPDCFATTASGTVFKDFNQDCSIDSGETRLSNTMILLLPDSLFCFTNDTGFYKFHSVIGSHSVVEILPNIYWQHSCDSIYNIVLDSITGSISNLNFGNYPKLGINDLAVDLTAGAVRPGFNCNFTLTYRNKGTTAQNALVALKLDSIFTFVSSNVTPALTVGDSLVWDIGMLQTDHFGSIHLQCHVSSLAEIGSLYHNVARIFPVDNDFYVADNIDSLNDLVVGSFDPNEKLVYPVALRSNDTLINNNVEYQINFQNTGTDTAFTVVVRDIIESNLDLGSFQMEASSHDYDVKIVNNRTLEWTFNNILLADSNTNEEASHGFVKFRIKAKPNNTHENKIINNKADIYFDYNVGVATNTVKLIQKGLPEDVDTAIVTYSNTFKVYPNPVTQNATVSYSIATDENVRFELFDILGRSLSGWTIGNQQAGAYQFELSNLQKFSSGIYTLTLNTSAEKAYRRFVLLH